MNMLICGAHPDDIEYGCGGLCIRHMKLNENYYSGLHWLVMTQGGSGGNERTRTAEQEAAAQFVGVQSFVWGGFKDAQLGPIQEVAKSIEAMLRLTASEELYLPFPQDTHQDHQMLASAGLIAGRWLKRILFYESYGTYGFEPDIFITLKQEDIQDKERLLSFHKSQIEKSSEKYNMIAGVWATAKYRGFQAREEFAEGYKAFRFVRE